MSDTGRFITVEGQDGAGKTTSIRFVERLVRERGFEPVVTREPGGTRLGEQLRRIILDGHEFHIDPVAELLMIFAARAQHLAETIRPALSQGRWVICDRFTDATFAYQSGGRGLPRRDVETLETLVQGRLRPDLTLLLDVDLETGLERADLRGRVETDRFEKEEIEFKSRVRNTYLDLAARHPDRIRIVDGTRTLAAVEGSIRDILDSFLDRAGAGQ